MSDVLCLVNTVQDVMSCDQHMHQILGALSCIFKQTKKIPQGTKQHFVV